MPEEQERDEVHVTTPPPSGTSPIANALAQYTVLGLLAFGGGGVGSVVTSTNTDVLEAELRHVKETLSEYHADVVRVTVELERRIDRLERRHPEILE